MTKNTLTSLTKPLLWSALAAAACATGCAQANASETPNHQTATPEDLLMKDIESLKQAEQVWVKSLVTADAKLLATLIDDQFTFIGPDAQVEERHAYLAGYEGMTQAGVVVDDIQLSELNFRVLDEVGIVTGRVAAKVTMQGAALVENVRFTRIYRRTGNGWKMMAGQGTRIPQTQG